MEVHTFFSVQRSHVVLVPFRRRVSALPVTDPIESALEVERHVTTVCPTVLLSSFVDETKYARHSMRSLLRTL